MRWVPLNLMCLFPVELKFQDILTSVDKIITHHAMHLAKRCQLAHLKQALCSIHVVDLLFAVT